MKWVKIKPKKLTENIKSNARGRRCGIKTQDWPAGATSTRPRANARGRRCGIRTLTGRAILTNSRRAEDVESPPKTGRRKHPQNLGQCLIPSASFPGRRSRYVGSLNMRRNTVISRLWKVWWSFIVIAFTEKILIFRVIASRPHNLNTKTRNGCAHSSLWHSV